MDYNNLISKNLKKLRLERSFSQKSLANILGVTQAHLSHLENGKTQLTAALFLKILQYFNLSLDYFLPETQKGQQGLQKALARLGASHLFEDPAILPSERLHKIVNVISETLIEGRSPRLIVSLAPIIIEHSDAHVLNKIRLILQKAGLNHRFVWLLENTLRSIDHILKNKALKTSNTLHRKFERARIIINNLLSFPFFTPQKLNQKFIDTLETDFNDEKTLKEIQEASSSISKKWNIASRIRPNDFEDAIKQAHDLL